MTCTKEINLPYGPKKPKNFPLAPDKKDPKPGACHASRCRNKATKKNRYCPRCNARRYKVLHPENYAFQKLKYSARRRGIEFYLSVEDFKKFWDEHGLYEGYGKQADNLTVDRIDSMGPYILDNIQPLTNRENGKKK